MDLSRIAIEPRLRDNWEAVDMGVAMVRAWWWPLQLSWLLPSLIVFSILLVIFSDTTWLAFLITWWLNPLWDRFPLVLASRALFNDPLNVKKAWSEWWPLFKRDWFAWLTWRRFSPTRAMDMPITVLEQLQGEIRSRRLNVLHRNTAGVAFLTTLLCILFELLVVAALWVFVLLFVPTEFWVEQAYSGFNDFFWFSKWSVVIWYCALVLVSPFYVVSGFALYINRRIELEGWDIEIRFRHLAQRVSEKPFPEKQGLGKQDKALSAKKIASWLLPLIVVGGMVGTPDILAQDQTDQPINAEAQAAKETIIEVLGGEDFVRKELDKGWRFKKETDEAGEESYWWVELLADILDFVAPFFEFISGIFQVVPILVWVAIGLFIAYVIYYFRDALSTIGRKREKETSIASPDVMFGLDLRTESLPDDVPTEVANLWRDGKHREAIGLLYRATLSGLIHQFSFEFFDGYTEQECAAIVNARNTDALSRYVQALTSVWQSIAYAHRLPAEEKVNHLCKEWPQHFHAVGEQTIDNKEGGQ